MKTRGHRSPPSRWSFANLRNTAPDSEFAEDFALLTQEVHRCRDRARLGHRRSASEPQAPFGLRQASRCCSNRLSRLTDRLPLKSGWKSSRRGRGAFGRAYSGHHLWASAISSKTPRISQKPAQSSKPVGQRTPSKFAFLTTVLVFQAKWSTKLANLMLPVERFVERKATKAGVFGLVRVHRQDIAGTNRRRNKICQQGDRRRKRPS